MGRILILDIDDDKHDGFVDAMSKRPHIRVISMEREARKALVDCPCCRKKLSRESSFVINDHMIESLTAIVEKMAVAKSVLIVNKDNPISAISSVERERCVEIDPATVVRAVTLGLLQSFQDGSKPSYFVTAAGLAFMLGESPAKPCTMVTLDGEVVELSGELTIENVKFKDQIKGDTARRLASKAVKSLPDSVTNFVTNGQMSLI
jgi:hypothetical protein